jgi:DNA-binding LytR/AlgR family response regulator
MSHGWTPERRWRQREAIQRWRPRERSTGPRTAEGKARASRNGWKGGTRPMLRQLARLLAIEAQDHYVRVHTERGAALVLMAFETALTRVAHLEGSRVHRSWWVARAAIDGVNRGDGRATLSLPGGIRVPVCRRYARLLRTAGCY